jgi:hypothetical protein
MAIVNPPPGYLGRLGPLPEGAELLARPADGACDFVQVFVASISPVRFRPLAVLV